MADFDATRALMDDDSFLPLIHGDPVGAAALIKSQSDEIERLRKRIKLLEDELDVAGERLRCLGKPTNAIDYVLGQSE